MATSTKFIVIDKATGQQTVATGQEVTLPPHSIVELAIPHAQVKTLARQGNDLVITTMDGQTVVVHGYFDGQVGDNSLVFSDDSGLWSTDLSNLDAQPVDGSIDVATATDAFMPMTSTDSMLDASVAGTDAATAAADGGASDIPLWVPLAVAGVGVAAIVVASNSGSGSNATPQAVAQQQPLISQNSDGTVTVTGKATPGDTVTVTFPDGTTVSATADATTGQYSIKSAAPETAAGAITITETDATGATVGAPITENFTPGVSPAAPAVTADTQNSDGTLTVSGTGVAGDTVTVNFADGSSVTTTVGADGAWSASSTGAQTIGNVTSVYQTDPATNLSSSVTPITATETTTQPTAPTVGTDTTDANGMVTVSGTATAGDIITVNFADGSSVTTTVSSDGTYSVTSAAAQTSSAVTVIDTSVASGFSSAPTTGSDTGSTGTLTVSNETINNDATLTVAGTGAAGDVVVVTYGDGTKASTTVGQDGSWSLQSPLAQTSVTSVVDASNGSTPNLAGITPTSSAGTNPGALTVINETINNDGTMTVTGTGTANDVVVVTYGDGTTASTTITANGTWSLNSPAAETSVTGVADSTNSSTADLSSVHPISSSSNSGSNNNSGNSGSNQPLAANGGLTVTNETQNGDGTLSVKGTGAAGDTITVTFGDGATASTTVGTDGSWSLTSSASQSSVTKVTDSATGATADLSGISVSSAAPSAPSGAATLPATLAPAITDQKQNGDGTLTVSGTGVVGDVIVVTFGDGAKGSATVDSSGSWSLQSSGSESSVSAVNDSTNGTSFTPTYTTATPPIATVVPQPPTATVVQNSDGTVTVNGKAGAGDTVTVQFADGSIVSGVAGSDGSYVIKSPANESSTTVSVTDTNAAGASKPTIANDSSGSGSSGSGSTTTTLPGSESVNPPMSVGSDGSLTVSGSGAPGGVVTVNWPDGSSATVTVDSSGHYTATSAPSQPSGSVGLSETDVTGAMSATTTIGYTQGATLAAPGVDSPTVNSNGTVTVTGTGVVGDTVTVQFADGSKGSAVVDANGHYSVTSASPESSANVSVTQSDASGNASGSISLDYSNASTPASPSTSSGAPSAPTVETPVQNDNGTLSVSGTATPGDTVTATFADGATVTAVVDSSGHYTLVSTTGETAANLIGVVDTNAAGVASPTGAIGSAPAPITVEAPVVTSSAVGADGTITINGTGVTGDVVTVTFNDGAMASATVDANGNFSLQSPGPESATSVLSLVQSDAAGNVSSTASLTPPPDAGAPAVVAPAAPAIAQAMNNADGTLTLTGTAQAGDLVTATFADGSAASVMADSSGNYVLTSATAESVSNLTGVIDTNVAGMSSASNATVAGIATGGGSILGANAVNVALTGLSTDNGATSTQNYITSDGRLMLEGTYGRPLTAGESVQVSVDGGQTWQSATVTGTNGSTGLTWNWTSATPLADSTYDVVVRVGSAAASRADVGTLVASQTITVDSLAPMEIVAVTGATTTSGSAPVGSAATGFITDQSNPTISGTISTALADGSAKGVSAETLQINLVDANGHSLTGGFVALPAAALSSSAGATTWSYTPAMPLNSGAYTVELQVADAAGNIGMPSAPVTLNVLGAATTSAFLSGIAPADSTGSIAQDPKTHGYVTNDSHLTISGSLGQPLAAGEHVAVIVDDGAGHVVTYDSAESPLLFSLPSGAGGNLNWTFTTPTQSDGTYTVTAEVLNALGKAGATTSATVLIDTHAPAEQAQLTSLTDSAGNSSTNFVTNVNYPTLEGSVSPQLASGSTNGVSAESLVVTLTGSNSNTVVSGVATVDGSGNWTFTPPHALTDDTYNVTLQVVDAAGNLGASSTASPLVIDTHAPSAVSFSQSNGALFTISPNDSGAVSGMSTSSTNFTVSGSFNGTLADGKTAGVSAEQIDVSVISGGQTIYTGAATVNGDIWSLNTGAAGIKLASGSTYSFQVSVDDAAGNHGVTSTGSVSVDSSVTASTATTTPSTSTPSSSSSSSSSSSNPTSGGSDVSTPSATANGVASPTLANITQNGDGTITVTGTGSPGDTISVTFADQSVVSATAGQDGSFSIISVNPEIGVGVTVTDTNAAGSMSNPVTGTATLNSGGSNPITTTVPPAPTEHAVQNADGTVTVTGVGVAGDLITVHFGDGAATGSAVAGADGSYTISSAAPLTVTTVNVVDTNSNGVASSSTAGTVDTSASSSSASAGTGSTGAGSSTGSGTDTTGSGSSGAGSATGTPADVSATLTGVSNQSQFSVTTGSSQILFTNDGLVTLNGSISGHLSTGEAVQVSLDGGKTWQPVTVGSDGLTWSYNSGHTLADGYYSVQTEVVDSTGAVVGTHTTMPVWVDSVSPTETVTINPTSDGAHVTGTISAALEPGNTTTGASQEGLAIQVDGGVPTQVTVAAGATTWSYAATLHNGPHEIMSAVMDAASNLGTKDTQHVMVGVDSSGNLNLSLADVVSDAKGLTTAAGTATPVTIATSDGVSQVTLSDGVGTGSTQWADTGTTQVINGTTYEIYHNAQQGTSTTADLLIQQGITVVG